MCLLGEHMGLIQVQVLEVRMHLELPELVSQPECLMAGSLAEVVTGLCWSMLAEQTWQLVLPFLTQV